jgi:hypothetical protein
MDNELEKTTTGAVKSTFDYRDSIFATANIAAQAIHQPIQTDFKRFGVLNQKKTPSCVSHSVVKLMELYWYLKTGKIVRLNPQFLHILSVFKGAGPDDGRDTRTVLLMAKKYGCATVETMPINTDVSNAQYCDPANITQEMRDEAIQYAIPGFISIDLTADAFQRAIEQYGAISTLFRVGNTFWTAPDGTITWDKSKIDPIRATSQITSAHQVTAIGAGNSDLNRGLNSWGEQWNDAGEFNFIFNEWLPYIWEAWAIVNPNPQALQLIQSLPPANQFTHKFQSTIRYGMSNPEVRALQIALAIDGDFDYPEITGNYGNITADAVTRFQTKHNVAPPDVIASLRGSRSQVGPATRAKLNELFNK